MKDINFSYYMISSVRTRKMNSNELSNTVSVKVCLYQL